MRARGFGQQLDELRPKPYAVQTYFKLGDGTFRQEIDAGRSFKNVSMINLALRTGLHSTRKAPFTRGAPTTLASSASGTARIAGGTVSIRSGHIPCSFSDRSACRSVRAVSMTFSSARRRRPALRRRVAARLAVLEAIRWRGDATLLATRLWNRRWGTRES